MSLLTSQHLTTVKAMIKQNPIFYSVQKEREIYMVKRALNQESNNLASNPYLITN